MFLLLTPTYNSKLQTENFQLRTTKAININATIQYNLFHHKSTAVEENTFFNLKVCKRSIRKLT